jgi:hypothetical protein
MKPSTAQLQLQPSENIDYNPMLGFIEQAIRIDPHTRQIETEHHPDLRQVADIIRDRRNPSSPQIK